MLKVGLTGSIGSGKSTVAKVFEMLGVPVYFTDIEAKLILNEQDIVSLVVEKLGTDILFENEIDRKKLASRIFNDIEALQWLNSVIHPRVRKNFFSWVESNSQYPYIIQESAIMLETGFSTYFNKIVVVTCPLEERISRVLSRDKMTREQVMERLENQWPEELKVQKADYIIENDDRKLAIPQILELHEIFLKMSAEFLQ